VSEDQYLDRRTSTRRCYHFAMAGKTFALIRSHKPELFKKVTGASFYLYPQLVWDYFLHALVMICVSPV